MGKSDHDILFLTLESNCPRGNPQECKYNFHKTDFNAFKQYLLDIDWSEIAILNTEEAMKFFYNKLYLGFEKFVPKTKAKVKDQPVWLTNKCLKLIRKKYHLFKRYKFSKTHYDFQRFIEVRNEAKRQIRKAVKEYEKKISDNCKLNVKGFWKYVNSKLKRSSGISNLTKPDGSLTKSDKEKAEILDSFFSSVFTEEDTNNIPTLSLRNKDMFLSDLIITKEAVKDKLNCLNTNKSMGPDGIPSIILKSLSNELCQPLSTIFNKSLSEGVVPKDWKCAEVTAIFKKGSKSDPGNYRPVSLTSIICKVLESFIRDQLMTYMEENNFFSDCQHGFRRHRSCVTQLLDAMNDFTELIENGDCIDSIYLDFRKAFDTVPHKRLINKLKAYGVNGPFLDWIESFLSNRKQRVKVNNSYSNYSSVKSGIPQGSILGPILFIIFINDLPDVVKSLCKIFADDTKIYNSHRKNSILQKDLLNLLKWSEIWQIHFNAIKCGVLHIGKKNLNHDYFIDENLTNKLNSVTTEKDVGVIFSSNLKFDEHISNVVKKANSLTGLLKRSFVYLDKSMFNKLFKGIVRPHLEYANVIWHPNYKRQSIEIEKVQRRATKILKEINVLSYSDRLKALNLPSLKYRRLRGDLIQAYKIIHDIDNLNKENFFKFNCSCTRNSDLKLYKELTKSRSRSNFLPHRINDSWNSLSHNAKTAKDLTTFKILIDSELAHLKYEFDE